MIQRPCRPWILIALAALALTILPAATPPLAAQGGTGGGFGGSGDASDRLARLLFAPELVMRHQTELGLSQKQKDTLIADLQATQSDLVPLQLEMAEVGGQLGRLLSQSAVDEEAAVAVAQRVMALESRIKTRHLRLAVRIKNMLTLEQQTTLRRIRARQWEQRRNGGGR